MAKGGEERVNVRGDLEPPINSAPSTQSQPMQALSAFRVVQFFTELLVFSIPDPLDQMPAGPLPDTHAGALWGGSTV